MKRTMGRTNLSSILLSIVFITPLCSQFTLAGPPWEQVHKLHALDGSSNDGFGFSVAATGNIVVIGAVNTNGNAFRPNSAYIFDITTGQQMFKLLAEDAGIYDDFGFSVAVDGDRAVIGADNAEGKVANSGAAYIFDVTTGKQLFKIGAYDGRLFDGFGFSVAVSGNLAVIGAPFDNDNGKHSGSAYVFDVTTGKQLRKLLASDGGSNDEFGYSVALDGNTAIIGMGNFIKGTQSAAYVFDVATGEQLFQLRTSDQRSSRAVGYSVAIQNNLAVIGAIHAEGNDGVFSGAAYLFDVTTGQQLLKFFSSDGSDDDKFGWSVALDGDVAIIGAIMDDDNGYFTGSAYAFSIKTGEQLFKFLDPDATRGEGFGDSVALSSNMAVIGASGDDSYGLGFGATFVFEKIPNVLDVSPDPLIARRDGTFTIANTLPSEKTWLIYSVDGLHQTFIRQLNVVIDLANPKLATRPSLTDADGDTLITLPMPAILQPIDIWFQAVQQRNITNFVPTQLVP